MTISGGIGALNYRKVLLSIGLTTLIPMVILTVRSWLHRSSSGDEHKYPRIGRLCRLVLLISTLLLASFDASLLLLHYGLATRRFTLSTGDQLFLSAYSTWSDQLFRSSCSQLTLTSSRPGIRAWLSATDQPHLAASRRSYTLTLINVPLPTELSWHRLEHNNTLEWGNSSQPVSITLFKGADIWAHRLTADPVQRQLLGFEKCCAWHLIHLTDQRDRHRVIIEQSDFYAATVHSTEHHEEHNVGWNGRFNASVNVDRSQWRQLPCDTLLCDGSSLSCSIDRTPASWIIDYAVADNSAPDYNVADLLLECHPRYLAIGFGFAGPPLACLIGVLTFVQCRKVRLFGKNTGDSGVKCDVVQHEMDDFGDAHSDVLDTSTTYEIDVV